MIKKADNNVRAYLAPVGLAVSLVFGGVGAANAGSHGGASFGPYLDDASGGMVLNGSGECWNTVGGVNKAMSACGDVMMGPKDSDGDGVVDSKDKCPGTPKGAAVDATGCPLDSDGDGVTDYGDKCPNTAKGAAVDANGCAIAGAAAVNTTVDRFDFDSSMLKGTMKAALDSVIGMLKGTPADESLEIVGHADSTGPEGYNQKLSERRAQSVADYLAGQGITNMSIKGMGESDPVADNGTREGRAMNRRVDVMTK